jgi:hypothetical protein
MDDLKNVIRKLGGIRPYKKGYMKDELQSVPVSLRRHSGIRSDVMAEILKREYPWLGVKTENDLYSRLEKGY